MAQYCNFVTTDVFTSLPFSGNPLAIVFLPKSGDLVLSQQQKQLIAREFNLSETIFVHDRADSADGERLVDIFTTDTEFPFAGHPTIGSASWLLNSAVAADEEAPAALRTKVGRIPVSTAPPRFSSAAVSASIPHNTRLHRKRFPATKLLRLQPALEPHVSESADFPIFSIVNGMSQCHIELPSLDALSAVATTTGSIPGEMYLDEGWGSDPIMMYFFVRGVHDEALGRQVMRTRIVEGQLEDSATGSAACGLGTYLSLTEGGEGVRRYDVIQGVEMGRRSEIGVDVAVRGGRVESVDLIGSAVEISSGRILVPR